MSINWKPLTSESDLETIDSDSLQNYVVIFKHSTSCSISAMAKMRLESSWDLELDVYYLDLLRLKNLSNLISERYEVHHESPQLLLIKDVKCVYDASHFDISVAEIKESIQYLDNASM